MTAAKKAASDIPTDKLLRLYDRMVAIRLFEERVNDLYTRALMPGLAHLYIGEEAIAVGAEVLLADHAQACAKRSGTTTTSPARTAATVTAWPRARRRI